MTPEQRADEAAELAAERGDVAETPDCYDCNRQWADCTCEGPQT